MANSRIGPSPIALNSNVGAWYVEGNGQGMTYDGTLCTGEVFAVNRDTGVCSRWDGSTLYPRGVTKHMPNLKDASGDPVALGGAPADGQPISFIEFGICAIKSNCATDDIPAGTPYKGQADGMIVNASPTDATSVDKMVARLLDFQDKNAASGAFAWFFWFGYMLNTNKTA
jgi:hypothetical protein